MEPIMFDALKDPRKGRQRCKNQEREGLPSAHLPIRATIDYVKSKSIAIANSKPQLTDRTSLLQPILVYSTMVKI